MRVERNDVAGLWEPSLGYLVRLSERERATLERAADILRELRERLEDDSDLATDVALAAYTCQDIISEPIQVDRPLRRDHERTDSDHQQRAQGHPGRV